MSDPVSMPMSAQQESLTKRVNEEFKRLGDRDFSLVLDTHSLLCLVSNLQLALRHPGNCGPSSQIARQTIDGLIERLEGAGYVALAELARLGDNPVYDVECG